MNRPELPPPLEPGLWGPVAASEIMLLGVGGLLTLAVATFLIVMVVRHQRREGSDRGDCE
jgi:hypothetical protein